MTDEERQAKRRAIIRRLRDTHQKMFDLQGDAISGLKDALAAVAATHDEMMAYFTAVNELDDVEGE
jgi:hypothetical protein